MDSCVGGKLLVSIPIRSVIRKEETRAQRARGLVEGGNLLVWLHRSSSDGRILLRFRGLTHPWPVY